MERGAEGWEGKSSGKNMLRNPLHNLPENLLNTWPLLTVFIDLILGTNKIKCSRKISISALLTMPVFDFVGHNKLWKTLKEIGIRDHLTCLLRNLYAVRTGYETTDWFQIGKGTHQGCILSPCLFNVYAEYIMRNAGLEEAKSGIKIVRRNINNLRYAVDTTVMAESKEELESLDESERREWKSWLKAQNSEN